MAANTSWAALGKATELRKRILFTLALLIVYRPQHLPDGRKSAEVWRKYCREVGIGEIHIACALTHCNRDHQQFGFDSGVEFPPHNMEAPNLSDQLPFTTRWRGYAPDYSPIADTYLDAKYGPERSVFRGVIPSWDNTARRGDDGTIILNGTPENYEFWLSEAIRQTREDFPGQRNRLVFVNAWNEWAEGCHLEPDRKYGHKFLEATLRAKAGTSLTGWSHVGGPQDVIIATRSTAPAPAPRRKKSALRRGFRAVRDTLNGRRFRKNYKKVS